MESFQKLKIVLLPLGLAVLFVLQNQLFNFWLEINPNLYTVRRILVTFATGVILYGPSLFFKKRGRYIYLLIISFFISSIFVAQFIYFQYAQSFLQVSALKYAALAISVLGAVFSLLSFKLLLFISGFLIVLFAFFVAFSKKYRLCDFAFSGAEKIIIFLHYISSPNLSR